MQRCSARSKRSGERCKNYAVRGFSVCRMHGARGGPRTCQGKERCRTAPLKHGFYSKQGYAGRKRLRMILKGNV